MRNTRRNRLLVAVLVGSLATSLAACGNGADDGNATPGTGSDTSLPAADATPGTVTLLAYDAFTPAEGIFDEFTEQTGATVRVVTGGDSGSVVNKAILTAGNPEGDVLWGVDNTLLSRAIADDVFEPYESPGLSAQSPDVTSLVPGHELTPVDTGDVCVNYDIAALEERGVPAPRSFEDLVDPRYRGMLVVQDPASSSPGLAFLMATVAAEGEDGWEGYWSALRDNDVLVVDSWSDAYYSSFTRSGGDRPLVVSYASSPPAEVLFADPPLPEGSPAPTGVVTATCFRQVEFAGILRGTRHRAEAEALIDFLIGTTFQSDLPLTQFVDPVNPDAKVPAAYSDYVVRPASSLALDPAVIDANRRDWLDRWTQIVLR